MAHIWNTDSFQDRFIKAITERIPNSRCPLCQSSDWEVQPGVYTFRERTMMGFSSSVGNGLPSGALVCKVCGNTQFVSLLIFGDQFSGDWQ